MNVKWKKINRHTPQATLLWVITEYAGETQVDIAMIRDGVWFFPEYPKYSYEMGDSCFTHYAPIIFPNP